jgi:hypothetical protein
VLFALRALLGTSGVDAQGQMQYLEREQEIVHALLRKPLLIGCGRGGSRFGWIAGPRLAIASGSMDFLHGPVRHDFAASVSVPAWLTHLRLRGRYHWIDDKGDLDDGKPIWSDGDVIVRLPMPEDRNRAITAALVSHHASALAAVYRDSARPRPRVERPARDSAGSNLLVAGEKNQRLLVMGEHLWREPQVFVGNQRADRVDVLADMNGVLAHFDELQFPGDPPERTRDGSIQDLHVITSYGRTHIPGAVTILPPRPKASAESQKSAAVLLTTFVSPDQRVLRFAFARPKAYAGLRLAMRPVGDAAWTYHVAPEQWSTKEDVVAIELPAWSGPPTVFEVVLEQQTRAGAEWAAVAKEAQRFVRFKAEADRAAVLRAGAAVDFDAGGKPKPGSDTILVTTSRDVHEAFEVAYPGFKKALDAATIRLTLSSPARPDAVSLAMRATPNAPQGPLFLVEVEELSAKVASLAGTGPPPREWIPALVFGAGDGAVTIPIVVDSGNPPAPARITAKRDAKTVGGVPIRAQNLVATSLVEEARDDSLRSVVHQSRWKAGVSSLLPTREMTVVAQDASIDGRNGNILIANISVLANEHMPGAMGFRVQIVDYEAITRTR